MALSVELFLLALLASTPDAPAPVPSLTLRWTAPRECPDEASVRNEVERLLGPYASGPHAPLNADAVVEPAEHGYTLRLVVRSADADGERILNARACEPLAEAAALVIAIAIDPRVLERVDEPTEPEPEPEPGAVPDPMAEPEPAPTTPPPTVAEAEPVPVAIDETAATTRNAARSRVHVGLAATAGVGLAILPGPAADLGLLASVFAERWRVELGGSYWTPSERRAPGNEAVGGRFMLWGIDARGCWVPGSPRVDVPLCLGAQLGAMHGRGVGELTPARREAAVWAAGLASASALFRPAVFSDRLGLGFRAEGLAALTRPQFGTAQSGVIHRARPGGVRVGGIIEVRLR